MVIETGPLERAIAACRSYCAIHGDSLRIEEYEYRPGLESFAIAVSALCPRCDRTVAFSSTLDFQTVQCFYGSAAPSIEERYATWARRTRLELRLYCLQAYERHTADGWRAYDDAAAAWADAHPAAVHEEAVV